MHSYTKLALALASTPLFSLVSAQTWTACDPTKQSCPPDPALAGLYNWQFGGAAPDFTVTAGADVIKYGGEAASFGVGKKGDAPTIVSNFYIMFGKIEVNMKAAPGGGVVSSVVLESDDLDEIDWEWVGSQTGQGQSNYFGKGFTGNYDRGAVHNVDAMNYHTYGLTWTDKSIEWLIDGNVVRTLTPDQVSGDHYPQTPMQLKIGSWAAGDPSNDPGVVQWSGGPINYGAGPYNMMVKSIMVQDYSTGKEYIYGDLSGSWKSIKATDGQVNVGPQSGQGNAANLGSPSASSSGIGSSQGPAGPSSGSAFNAPSNSGLIVSATPTSKPTSGSGSSATTNSPESTPTSSSPSSPASHTSGSGSSQVTQAPKPASNGVLLIAINGTTSTVFGTGAASGVLPAPTNGTAPNAPAQPTIQTVGTSAGSKTSGTLGIYFSVAGMIVAAWLL